MTSSPGPTSKTLRERNRADVQDERAAAFDVPIYAANFFSNSFVLGPVPVQAVLTQFATASTSSSVYDGGENGRLLICDA